jgi:hypothetical protein
VEPCRVTSMRLRQLRTEIEESGRCLFGEKAYPITSNWVPITDVLAIIDRFEKQLQEEVETTLSKAKAYSGQQAKEFARAITTDLLG